MIESYGSLKMHYYSDFLNRVSTEYNGTNITVHVISFFYVERVPTLLYNTIYCKRGVDATLTYFLPLSPTDDNSGQLAAIVVALVVLGCVSLVILLCVCGSRDRTCFRQSKMPFKSRRGSFSVSVEL